MHPCCIDKLAAFLEIDLSHVSLLKNHAVLAAVIWPSALRKMAGFAWRVGSTRLTIIHAKTLMYLSVAAPQSELAGIMAQDDKKMTLPSA
jgi:hypothetical protein